MHKGTFIGIGITMWDEKFCRCSSGSHGGLGDREKRDGDGHIIMHDFMKHQDTGSGPPLLEGVPLKMWFQ